MCVVLTWQVLVIHERDDEVGQHRRAPRGHRGAVLEVGVPVDVPTVGEVARPGQVIGPVTHISSFAIFSRRRHRSSILSELFSLSSCSEELGSRWAIQA